MMIILGIDPGSRATGLAAIDWTPHKVHVIHLGYWRPSCTQWTCRVLELFEVIELWLQEYTPAATALEEVFIHPDHPRPALVLQQIIGVIESALAHSGFGWVTYAPRTVKKTIAGSGGADKRTLMQRLRLLTPGLEEWDHMPGDSFDALAVALCHGFLDGSPTLPHHTHKEVPV